MTRDKRQVIKYNFIKNTFNFGGVLFFLILLYYTLIIIFILFMKKIKSKQNNSEFDSVQLIYLLGGIVLLVGIILGIWFAYDYFINEKKDMALVNLQTEEQNNKICKYQRILDGVCVETESEVNPKLVAIMVENHSEARPQSGLSQASVVYEAPVEANYTRFLLIFPANVSVSEVGPVRSVRPYYLDWLNEYGGAQYMHVGGSPAALEKIIQENVNDLNEFYRGWYYWRSDRRSAPHNVYTSSELWNKALVAYEDNYKNQEYDGWKFATSSPNHLITQSPENIQVDDLSKIGGNEVTKWSGDQVVGEIKVSFLPPVYEAVWKYNTSTNQYVRYQMNQPHTDYDGTPIVADNVIVQKVTSQVLDTVGRLAIDTIGTGEVIVFQNGKMITGTWKKDGRESRTRFYDANNNEIKLNSGKIWIEVVNERTGVSY